MYIKYHIKICRPTLKKLLTTILSGCPNLTFIYFHRMFRKRISYVKKQHVYSYSTSAIWKRANYLRSIWSFWLDYIDFWRPWRHLCAAPKENNWFYNKWKTPRVSEIVSSVKLISYKATEFPGKRQFNNLEIYKILLPGYFCLIKFVEEELWILCSLGQSVSKLG